MIVFVDVGHTPASSQEIKSKGLPTGKRRS